MSVTTAEASAVLARMPIVAMTRQESETISVILFSAINQGAKEPSRHTYVDKISMKSAALHIGLLGSRIGTRFIRMLRASTIKLQNHICGRHGANKKRYRLRYEEFERKVGAFTTAVRKKQKTPITYTRVVMMESHKPSK
mmetsp:Transcript_23483/g.65299  ORF Transcript_23483/g.65299 Transcript_23483/m.65299 type:complete len:140 (-) Transcript_23483:1409-1828(-)